MMLLGVCMGKFAVVLKGEILDFSFSAVGGLFVPFAQKLFTERQVSTVRAS